MPLVIAEVLASNSRNCYGLAKVEVDMGASNRLSGTPDDIVNSFAKDLNVESPSGSTTQERLTNLIASVHAEITRSPEQYRSTTNSNTLGELHAFANSLGGVHSAAQEMLNQSLQSVRKGVSLAETIPNVSQVQEKIANIEQKASPTPVISKAAQLPATLPSSISQVVKEVEEKVVKGGQGVVADGVHKAPLSQITGKASPLPVTTSSIIPQVSENAEAIVQEGQGIVADVERKIPLSQITGKASPLPLTTPSIIPQVPENAEAIVQGGQGIVADVERKIPLSQITGKPLPLGTTAPLPPPEVPEFPSEQVVEQAILPKPEIGDVLVAKATQVPVPQTANFEAVNVEVTEISQLVSQNQPLIKQDPFLVASSAAIQNPEIPLSKIPSSQTGGSIASDMPETYTAKSVPDWQAQQKDLPLFTPKVIPEVIEKLLERLSIVQKTHPLEYQELLKLPQTKVAVIEAARQLIVEKILEVDERASNVEHLPPHAKGVRDVDVRFARLDELLKVLSHMNPSLFNPSLPLQTVGIGLVELLLINLQYAQSFFPVLYSNALSDPTTKQALNKEITKHANKLTNLEMRFLQHPLTQEQWKEYQERRAQLTQLVKVMKESNPSFDLLTIGDAKYLLPADAVGLIQAVHCGLKLTQEHINQLFLRNDVLPEEILLYYVKGIGLVQNGKSEESYTKITRHTIEATLQVLRDPERARNCLSRNRINALYPAWKITEWP